MTEVTVEEMSSPKELLAEGRRHLAVKDYNAAVETFTKACGLLATEYGDTADQCAEAYLWYGKALLGLYREESGVLGDGVPGTGNVDEDDEDEDENGEEDQNGEEANGEENDKEGDTKEQKKEVKENGDCVEKTEAESTTTDEEPGSSKPEGEPGTSNGDADAADESTVNMDDENDVDNLQLAWEMLDLSRSILHRRLAGGGDAAEGAKALLAEAHLALGEVALESETYDKAVIDMQSCLDLQKELYRSDDRRIAETHYQIGLANSLASNFEDAITHFKNAANILESRIKMLEFPTADSGDASAKKLASDPTYSVEAEIKELKELLPEIQEKIQDMMDYKAETLRRVRESLLGTNGDESKASGSSPFASSSGATSSGASSSTAKPVSDISHLVKRKRKPSEEEEKPAKRTNTST